MLVSWLLQAAHIGVAKRFFSVIARLNGRRIEYDFYVDGERHMEASSDQAPPSQGQTKPAPAEKPASSGSGLDDFKGDVPF